MSLVLVVGAKGMLGRDLVEVMRRCPGYDVVGWDIEELDITIEKETIDRIWRLRPAIVINLAAYTDVDGCELDSTKAFAVNALGMRNVALAASRCDASVVYLSTDYIFDGQKAGPYTETDIAHPLNVYGRSKLKGERYAEALVRDALIVRSQWLFGRFGRNFVSSILEQASEKKELHVVDDQIGSPTYTVDLANVIVQLIQRRASGIFHVANSDSCSWYTFAKAILEVSGITGVEIRAISSRELRRPAKRPAYSVLGCERLKRETGIELRSWQEALREFLREVTIPDTLH